MYKGEKNMSLQNMPLGHIIGLNLLKCQCKKDTLTLLCPLLKGGTKSSMWRYSRSARRIGDILTTRDREFKFKKAV